MDKLTVFYDGKCNLCFREIRHYKKLDKKNNLVTIDISARDFDAKSYGLDPQRVQVHMHSKSEGGEIYIGVDTFAEIWKRIQPYDKASFILESKLLRPLFDFGYKLFAHKIRPNLPKRKCDNDSCEIMV
jgi:predicted DCC family thiol-disulfide oxidoreductase YuxK